MPTGVYGAPSGYTKPSFFGLVLGQPALCAAATCTVPAWPCNDEWSELVLQLHEPSLGGLNRTRHTPLPS